MNATDRAAQAQLDKQRDEEQRGLYALTVALVMAAVLAIIHALGGWAAHLGALGLFALWLALAIHAHVTTPRGKP